MCFIFIFLINNNIYTNYCLYKTTLKNDNFSIIQIVKLIRSINKNTIIYKTNRDMYLYLIYIPISLLEHTLVNMLHVSSHHGALFNGSIYFVLFLK